MFREKNLGNSVDDGVRDNGGMCRKAFLEGEHTEKQIVRLDSLRDQLKHHIDY